MELKEFGIITLSSFLGFGGTYVILFLLSLLKNFVSSKETLYPKGNNDELLFAANDSNEKGIWPISLWEINKLPLSKSSGSSLKETSVLYKQSNSLITIFWFSVGNTINGLPLVKFMTKEYGCNKTSSVWLWKL